MNELLKVDAKGEGGEKKRRVAHDREDGSLFFLIGKHERTLFQAERS
jgi:hypothetical protein